MLQMCRHTIVTHKLNAKFTLCQCNHCMNLPCDAVTVLMVIACVLIYVNIISYFIHIYKLLQSSGCTEPH